MAKIAFGGGGDPDAAAADLERAGRSKTARVDGKVVRINRPHSDGRASLAQRDIARWPHSAGLKFGPLGSQDPGH